MKCLPKQKKEGIPINSKKSCGTKYTSIGGQACIEAVMMRGPHTSALAVRKPDSTIHTETWNTFSGGKKPWYQSVPLVRGCFGFVESLRVGYRCLMRSADLAELEEEPSPLEQKLTALFGSGFSSVLSFLAMALGAGIAIVLFMVLPAFLVNTLTSFGLLPPWGRTIAEGVLKIIIFVLYLAVVSLSLIHI